MQGCSGCRRRDMTIATSDMTSEAPLMSREKRSVERHSTTLSDVKDVLPLVLTVADIGKTMRLSKVKAYELIHQKGFPLILCGRAIRIPRDAFFRWLESQAAGE
jgi:excisionase family DNA binding protein